jgi:hypothetical protein
MPFLFHIPKDGSPGMEKMKWVDQDEFIVIIASFGYSQESTAWMDDPHLGKECLVPSLDLEKEPPQTFATEQEALRFMAEWWKKQIT